MKIPQPIPTNIITGFLGSGKTTLIQALLKGKPADEKWAILVNEFGEVGIDGGIVDGSNQDKQVFIREVPGGCMCCTSGLPMQIALNQLISRAQPDRLLIEPTGLGHPKEVIDTFAEPHYQDIIKLNATFTLLDARKLSDERYRQHQGFKEQLEVADFVLASKSDLYQGDELQWVAPFLQQLGCADTPIYAISQGKIEPALLDTQSKSSPQPDKHHHHHHAAVEPIDLQQQVKQHGFVSVENQGEGYVSKGWIFSPDTLFDYQSLVSLVHEVDVERFKGVAITNQGIFSFNKAEDVLTTQELDESFDSRFEVIHRDKGAWEHLERKIKLAQI